MSQNDTVIRIKGKEYKFRYCWGAMYVFEKFTDEPINLNKVLHQHLLFYSMLLYNNKEDFDIQFPDFIELLEDPAFYKEISEKFAGQMAERNQYRDEPEEEGDSKKKV